MKQQLEKIIDKIADRELKFGCVVKTRQYAHLGEMMIVKADNIRDGDYQVMCDNSLFYQRKRDMEVIGHPVNIGDVLEKMKNGDFAPCNDIDCSILSHYEELLRLWEKCGYKTNLNEILEGEWECDCNIEKIRNGCWRVYYDGEKHSEHSLRIGAINMAKQFEFPKNKAHKDLIKFLIDLKL